MGIQRHRIVTASAVVCLAAPLLAFGVPTQAPASELAGGVALAADTRPNIVLIMADDMAAHDLQAMPRTRRLIQSEGMTFANSFAPFPLCCPARVTMLTGQYAHNHGVLGNGDRHHPEGGYSAFTSDDNTVATWLDDAGYQTALVGKYINGYGEPGAPLRVPPGWDEWYGAIGGNYTSLDAFENGQLNSYPHTYRTSYINNAAVDIIRRRVDNDAPLMLFVWHQGPHNGRPRESDDPPVTLGVPIETPAPARVDRDTFRGTPVPRGPAFNEADLSDKPAVGRALLTNRQVRALDELYQQRLETLQAVDRGVKQIVQQLRAAGELDNTVIAFTSDNGYLLGEHRIIESKGVFYEPGIRVPLLLRGPGIAPGTTREQLVGQIDLAPTFAQLAGAQPARTMDGVSLTGLIRDPQQMADRDIVFEMGPTRIGGPMKYIGLRTGRYTYAERDSGERELYDLREDPLQLSNLIGDPRLDPQVEARLVAQLADMYDCAGAECREPTSY